MAVIIDQFRLKRYEWFDGLQIWLKWLSKMFYRAWNAGHENLVKYTCMYQIILLFWCQLKPKIFNLVKIFYIFSIKLPFTLFLKTDSWGLNDFNDSSIWIATHYLMRFEPNWKKILQNSGKWIWIPEGM